MVERDASRVWGDEGGRGVGGRNFDKVGERGGEGERWLLNG